MTFRVTGRVRMPVGTKVERKTVVIGPSQAMCEACEWFQRSVSRCVHPRNGCTSGGHRIMPWTHPRSCPVSRVNTSPAVGVAPSPAQA